MRLPTKPGHEVLVVYSSITALTFALTRLRGIEPFEQYISLIVGALFLFSALHLANREKNGVRRFGIDVGGLIGPPQEEEEGSYGFLGINDLVRTLRRGFPSALREIGIALGVAIVIFPLFAIGFAFWHEPNHTFVFRPPSDLASFVGAQFVVVGLPEEAFFRGYIQTRLSDEGSFLRAWLVQAALFALIHFVVDLNPARLAVFFPGLLFGWIRKWRKGIGAAIVLHALSNVYSEFLVRGWLYSYPTP